jgi:hypothetical protein
MSSLCSIAESWATRNPMFANVGGEQGWPNLRGVPVDRFSAESLARTSAGRHATEERWKRRGTAADNQAIAWAGGSQRRIGQLGG